MSDAADARLTEGTESRPERDLSRAMAWRAAHLAWLLVLMLAVLTAAGRPPDEPAVAGRPMLGAVREALIAVVPDRTTVATRIVPATAMRQWASTADDHGSASRPGPAAIAAPARQGVVGAGGPALADATPSGPAGHHAASPFQARAPPAGA